MLKNKKRGILLPVFSLPEIDGIGGFGKKAKEFIDFLNETGFEIWQILPLNYPDSYLSPYNPVSSFTLNPFFITIENLYEEGLIDENLIKKIPSFNKDKIEISKVIKYKNKIFELAYKNFNDKKNKKLIHEFEEFISEFEEIENISFFIVLTKKFRKPIFEWDKEFKYFEKAKKLKRKFKEEIRKEMFFQFLAHKKWKEIKNYANLKGIKIFGDIPFYVSLNSYEVWKYPEFFLIEKDLKPIFVGGVPPDMFSKNGQLWGNPCYNWEELEKNKFWLLVERIKFSKKIYDYIRLDHFRGFEGVYIVRFGEKTARRGEWIKVNGDKFFEILKKEFKSLNFLIAEDLGFITESVIKLRKKFKIPGMKVFQFEFENIREWEKNSVSYTSTHDSPTLKEWLETLPKNELKKLLNALNLKKINLYEILKKFFTLSNSNWKIVQFQDIVGMGKEGRINIPGTKRGNWVKRIREREIIKAKRIISNLFSFQ